MSDNDGGNVGAFLAGFIIGGLVGAATAMILAPTSGAELREQLMNINSEELRLAGQSRFDTLRSSAQEAGAAAHEKMRIVLDEGKTRVTSAVDANRDESAAASDVTYLSNDNGAEAGDDSTAA